MSVDTVVVNYGCPRSGTTFMRNVLGRLQGVFAFKLAEGRHLHPYKNPDGLVDLHRMLRHRRLVLIRTVRHPLEIAESFAALRDPQLHEVDGAPMNLAKFRDPKAVEFIRIESENTALQRAALLEPEHKHEGLWFIEIRYEDLADAKKRARFVRQVTDPLPTPEKNHEILARALTEFGTKPIRRGRLRAGLGRITTPQRRAWFREQLKDVIEREGYADAGPNG